MPSSTEVVSAVYDVKQRKIACAIIQAAAGVRQYNKVIHLFDNWETNPTEDMRLIRGTMEEWKAEAERSNKRK